MRGVPKGYKPFLLNFGQFMTSKKLQAELETKCQALV